MKQQKSFSENNPGQGQLFLVPTPIGNLEDMTYRAVTTLKEVDIILAEDTRNSGILLKHYQITTPMKSFHEFSSQEIVDSVVSQMEQGQSYALISDAGMPLINDPGHPLVQAVLTAGLSVIALPGANAALTALVASGMPSDRFTYYGFLPKKKKEQEALLEEIGKRNGTAILYESPHRIEKSLQQIGQVLPENTQVVIARELTKKFEEYLRGSLGELQTYLASYPIKGEIVLLIEGNTLQTFDREDVTPETLKNQVQKLISENGIAPSEAMKQVAKKNKIKKQIIYNAYHDL